MSRYTVYNLAVDVQKKLHGGDINDLASSLDEGRRNMIKVINPPELVRSAYMEQAVYDKVDKYAVAEDLNYDNVIEIKKLSAYRNVDTMEHPLEVVFRRHFDQKRRGSKNIFTIANENGVKYAMLSHPKGLKECQQITINATNSLNQNGTWNVGGNVVNLRLDELNHITKKASLKFDLNDSSTTGFLENFTMDPIDIHDYLARGAEFNWFYIPIPQNIISVKLTLGSNPTNLTTDIYTATVNQPHDNNQFIAGWNLLKYMLQELNSVGNPNPKAICYIRLDFETTGDPIPACNIDSFVVRNGVVYWYLYNSEYCLIDSVTRAWKQITTSNSDIIPVEIDTYQILMLETALVEQEYLYANNFGAQSDVESIKGKLFDAYTQYKLNHTDETMVPEENTYVGGNMYDGYESESLNDGRYGDQDNDGDVGTNVNNNQI